MRPFHPIARRMEEEQNRNLWAPSPALRAIAWCVLLGALAYEVIAGWRVAVYLLAVQNNPAYELTHKWPGSPLLAVAPIAMILCIPFILTRAPRPRKKHEVDPALSILPR